MASKIKKNEWLILLALTGTIDLVQFFADLFLTEFFGAPEIVSEIADPFIGIGLVTYLQLRGVEMIRNPKRLLSLLGVTGLEELTGGLAPAWVLDIWYIRNSVQQEEAAIKAQKEQEMNLSDIRQPLYSNGRRAPRAEIEERTKTAQRPVNNMGSRRPGNIRPLR